MPCIGGIIALEEFVIEWRRKTYNNILRALSRDINKTLWKHRREESELQLRDLGDRFVEYGVVELGCEE